MRAILLNPPRRRGAWKRYHRRGRKRNDGGSTWIPDFCDRIVSENKGRRRRTRRRARNAAFSYGTAYTRNPSTWIPAFKNPYWVPRYAMNPGGGMVGKLTAGYQPKLLMASLPYVGGALGNAILATWLKKLTIMPSMFKTGIGNTVLNLASAGLLGAGVGMLSPKYAGPVFMGGVVDAVISVFNQYLPMKGCCGGYGMDDYLTPGNAAAALPLGHMSEYLTTQDAASAQALGDLDDTYTLPDLPSDVAPYSSEAFV